MVYKVKFCDAAVLNLIKSNKKKILSRSSIILDCHVGKVFNVHRGNKFVPLTINPRMKGYRFGDFCLTRKQFSHKKKKK
jgi:ribosomal protein S19